MSNEQAQRAGGGYGGGTVSWGRGADEQHFCQQIVFCQA